MRSLKFLSFFLLLASLPAVAQVGLYSEFSTTNIQAVGEPRMYGITFGVYKDKSFKRHLSFLSLGPDVRLSLQSGTVGSGIYSGGPAQSLVGFLLGPRLAFKLPVASLLHPYLEGLIGGGDSQIGELIPDGAPGNTNDINKNGGGTMMGQILGGLDLKLSSHVDWRAVEFNYGGIFVSAGGIQDLGITTFSTGIVIRLPQH